MSSRSVRETGENAPGGVRRAFGLLRYSLPVLVPLALLAQVAILGLKPALTEHERLLREEVVVTERHMAAEQEYRTRQAEAEAWHDPVYRERLRRVRGEEAE